MPSFSSQPQWPLTTCCLSIYILDIVRTSSPYISSRASRKRRSPFFAKGPLNHLFVLYVLYLNSFTSSEYYIKYHFASHAIGSIIFYIVYFFENYSYITVTSNFNRIIHIEIQNEQFGAISNYNSTIFINQIYVRS